MDFAIAGAAAVCAGFFTNPLEVVKIRMQLQGELAKKGHHVVHYRNVGHAAYQILRHDGALALQNGLVPGLWVQLIMNGSRLGGYQLAENMNLLHDNKGDLIVWRGAVAAGIWGVIGHYSANPMFLIKTHRQSMAVKAIAVGTQHKHAPLHTSLINIFKTQGWHGLARGGVAVFPRAFVASSSQLMGFGLTKERLLQYEYFRDRKITTSFCSSMIGGIAISVFTAPFDLILTRMYNQGIGSDGRGLLYDGYFDCIRKVYKMEGPSAFYKGIGPMYMRLGPHSVLTLMFWDFFKHLHVRMSGNEVM